MTNLDTTIPEDVSQAQETKANEKDSANAYTSTKHCTTSATEWLNVKQSACVNKTTNTANFERNVNNKRNMNAEEFTRQLNYFNMQNNTYLKAGYSDSQAATYYGWLPGISPVRFPTLIYPHSFVGFAPTVAWMKTSGGTAGQAANIEKIDRWNEGSEKESNSSRRCESPAYSERMKDETKSNSNNSDEDEGLVLDEREMLKRRREKDLEKLQVMKPQERSSVIQENITIQAKPSVITHVQDTTIKNLEQEQNKPAKRGRASTRQIEKTEQYWDRRKKNNVSAKKSRDARRQREAFTNQRSAMLETENLRLRAELATLRDENTRLKQELSSLKSAHS